MLKVSNVHKFPSLPLSRTQTHTRARTRAEDDSLLGLLHNSIVPRLNVALYDCFICNDNFVQSLFKLIDLCHASRFFSARYTTVLNFVFAALFLPKVLALKEH